MSCQTHLGSVEITQRSFFQNNMKLYIKSAACISAQNTFEAKEVPQEIKELSTSFLSCQAPEYKKYISPKLLRRMSPIIRNGICCSKLALEKAGIEVPDAIIVGTALGCLKDTNTFLSQLIEGNEELPNPTAFIQSTHNTIAGQIALLIGCKGYNFTFSQMHRSFENALLDAQMLLWDNEATDVLVGGIDELPEPIAGLLDQSSCYKNRLLGEGAGFFVLSAEKSAVYLRGLKTINSKDFDIEKALESFELTPADIDLVIGGDANLNDKAYTDVFNTFSKKPYAIYKPFVGEFGTVSSIAMWLAVRVIEQQCVPVKWCKNAMTTTKFKNILVYNRIGNEHSLVVLSSNV